MKLLFTEITEKERQNILEMHERFKHLIKEYDDFSKFPNYNVADNTRVVKPMPINFPVQPQTLNQQGVNLTPKQIEAANAGWGAVTNEYALTLPVNSQGRIISKQVATKSSTTPAVSQAKKPVQFISDIIKSTKDPSGKNYDWNAVKAAWQVENDKLPLGSREQNMALAKAWKGGWRPSTTEKTLTKKPVVPFERKGISDKTNAGQDNTTTQQSGDTPKPGDISKSYNVVKQLSNSLKGNIGVDEQIYYTGSKLDDTNKAAMMNYFNLMGYQLKPNSETASGMMTFIKKPKGAETPSNTSQSQSQPENNILPDKLAPRPKTQIQSQTPEQFYQSAVDANLIKQVSDRKIRYVGGTLLPDQRALLDQAMDNMGYRFKREGNDNRLVYVKK